MTEVIKQWIEDQTESARANNHYPPDNLIGMRMGLTKGIEIAEGFGEWLEDGPYFFAASGKWNTMADPKTMFTTPQLLEKYLNQLEK